MVSVKREIARRVEALLGPGEVELARPDGDPGLFGPGSASWAVHGDFSSMLIGGVSALLVQMLHPRVLAGVWDHSGFRKDWMGRLRRTAQFVGTATYGPGAQVEAAVARVRRVHAHVRGTLPDGTPYAADEPELLTWVHVAEVDAFLRAHLRYRDPWFPPERQDAYLAEQARLARMLGALEVPETRAELAAYLRRMRPELRSDARTREVSRLMLAQPSPSLATAPANALMLWAGVELLPEWARRMHGLRMPFPGAAAVRAGALGVGGVLRWAMKA
ncbi:oxygenase MpaB family protein [uncultured Sphingomonas sp.]|uniref:oxygenase MpaB family protein n=1 Tax=uncultured Sphingomonas sp. TaxID=158754 RepID=UPI0035C9D3CC